jgi:hypothetical protein
MSRTVRRKSQSRRHGRGGWYIPDGFKIACYYTEYDYHSTYHEPDWDGPLYTYREPTKRERFRTWKYMHGESSHRNAFSPGHEYRNNRMRENRSINNQELIKWIKDPENYEPMFENNPRSCLWDWS